jgi:hypothetical protein
VALLAALLLLQQQGGGLAPAAAAQLADAVLPVASKLLVVKPDSALHLGEEGVKVSTAGGEGSNTCARRHAQVASGACAGAVLYRTQFHSG